jgi:hypothetical protein
MDSRELEYKPLQTVSSNHADLDLEYAECIDNCTQQLLTNSCSAMCGCCTSCMKGLTIVAETVGTIIVKPVGRSIHSFLLGPNGNDPWELPKNIVMIPGNILIVLLEILTRVKKTGVEEQKTDELTLSIPFAGAVGRVLQALDYVFHSSCRSELSAAKRVKYTAAGINALLFSGYCTLYAMMISTMATEPDHRNLETLRTLDPRDMVAMLYDTSWNWLQIFTTSVGGYVVANNALIFGRDLVLHKFSDAYHWFLGAIRRDAIEHSINVAEENPIPKNNTTFQGDLQKEKAWYFTDILGRSIELILREALQLLRQPRKNLEGLTFYKPILKKIEHAKNAAGHYTQRSSCGAKAMRYVLGPCYNHTGLGMELISQQTYEDMLAQRKSSYSRVAPSSATSRLFNSDWREIRLNKELEDHYLKSVEMYQRHRRMSDIPPPFLSHGSQSQDAWRLSVEQDQQLMNMLNANLTDLQLNEVEGFSLENIAKEYNKRLYAFYTTGEAPAPIVPQFN